MKKYLAFDIEAANGYKHYSICSIGIVIADANFNIIHSQNILINPRTKYNLNGSRKNVDIDLHLDQAVLDASPDFPAMYETIKGYLTDDYVVVGHAVESDVYMLNCACKHYNLPSINFDFICSQLLYRVYEGAREVKALHKIADAIGVTFCAHNSEEDALVSMKTLAYLTQQTGLTVQQLVEKYAIRIGNNRDYVLTRPVSLTENVGKKQVRQKSREWILDYIANNTFDKKSQLYKGKAFAVARSIEMSQKRMSQVLDTIYANGGIYVPKLSQCTCYLADIKCVNIDKSREDKALRLKKDGLLEFMTIEYLDKND